MKKDFFDIFRKWKTWKCPHDPKCFGSFYSGCPKIILIIALLCSSNSIFFKTFNPLFFPIPLFLPFFFCCKTFPCPPGGASKIVFLWNIFRTYLVHLQKIFGIPQIVLFKFKKNKWFRLLTFTVCADMHHKKSIPGTNLNKML